MVDRPELIIHLNLPIIQVFYSQISSLLFKNMSLLFKLKQQCDKLVFYLQRRTVCTCAVLHCTIEEPIIQLLQNAAYYSKK